MPDEEALAEFERAYRNILTNCLGWSDDHVASWVHRQFMSCAGIPQFYNNPPAFYVTNEFVPAGVRSRLTPEEFQELWLKIYQALESRGHWNDFAKPEDRKAVCSLIDDILRSARFA